jgi:hypothetical protein
MNTGPICKREVVTVAIAEQLINVAGSIRNELRIERVVRWRGDS